MDARSRITAIFSGKKPDRIPFVPAIYEHKAFLIGKTPSEVARNPKLFLQSIKKEIEIYDPDFITVGLDVYNVEAEALGAEVIFFDGNDIPGIRGPIIHEKHDIDKLKAPDPETAARMPMFLEVAKEIHKQYGGGTIVRGSVSGPFSLASELYSFDKLLMDTIMEPEFVNDLLRICNEVIIAFARAYRKRGADVIVFDSRCAPPLISPDIYESIVLPYHNQLFSVLQETGQQIRPLVIGGDTTQMAENIFKSGANLILSDFPTDFQTFMSLAEKGDFLIRRNIDPKILQTGPVQTIKDEIYKIIEQAAGFKKLIVGTGVTPYDTPIENILAAKEAVIEKGVYR